MTRQEIEELVRAVARSVLETLRTDPAGSCCGKCAGRPAPEPVSVPPPGGAGSFDGKVLTEKQVLEFVSRGVSSLTLHGKTVVTPLARDVAAEKGLCLSRAGTPGAGEAAPSRAGEIFLILTGQSRTQEGAVVKAAERAGARCEVHRLEDLSGRSIQDAVRRGASRLSRGEAQRVILLTDDAFQLSFQASRSEGVRPLVCWDVETALESRRERNSNFLLLNPRQLGMPMLSKIVSSWLGCE